MNIEMNAGLMESMVQDWLADNSPEMDDLILDREPYFSEELNEWQQEAHDEEHDYLLVARDGYIRLDYVGTRL